MSLAIRRAGTTSSRSPRAPASARPGWHRSRDASIPTSRLLVSHVWPVSDGPNGTRSTCLTGPIPALPCPTSRRADRPADVCHPAIVRARDAIATIDLFARGWLLDRPSAIGRCSPAMGQPIGGSGRAPPLPAAQRGVSVRPGRRGPVLERAGRTSPGRRPLRDLRPEPRDGSDLCSDSAGDDHDACSHGTAHAAGTARAPGGTAG